MAHAIKLTTDHLERISQETGQSQRYFYDALVEATSTGETRYIVFDVTVDGIHYSWVDLCEDEFLDKYDWVDPTRTDKICLA